MGKRIPLTEAQWRKAWFFYAWRPEISVVEIATTIGLGKYGFYRRIREKGWPRRAEAIAQAEEERASCTDLSAAARALGRSVLAEIERLETSLADPAKDPERTARLLASLAKTLATAQSLQDEDAREREKGRSAHGERSDEHDDDEPPPRSLDELRDELARHLDRIVSDEKAAGSDDFLHIARACEAS